MTTNEIAVKTLTFEEGFSEYPYYCSEGYPTIGIGQRIGSKGEPLSKYHFTCPLSVAERWCNEEVKRLSTTLSKYDWYMNCGPNRQAMLISMAYQMGINGLLGFRKMLAAFKHHDWKNAYIEGLNSRWAKQTPERASRQMTVIRFDKLDGCY